MILLRHLFWEPSVPWVFLSFMKSQAIVENSSLLKDLFIILRQIIFLFRLLSILVALDLGDR
jgi:hypothetical protein